MYLWANYRKTAFQYFIASYNNAFRIMHNLSMRCSASLMFVSSGTDCCNTILRKCLYNLMCRISASMNKFVQSIEYSGVYNTSVLCMKWIRAIYTFL